MTDLGKQIEEALTMTIQKALEESLEKVADTVVERILNQGNRSHMRLWTRPEEPEYYTRREVEDILNVSITTIMRWEEQGRIKSEKIRGRRLYRRTMIDSLRKSGDLYKYCAR